MSDRSYPRIIEALEEGRRALTRARLTAGLLRFLGIALATLAGLVLWVILQKALRLYSVPLATGASLLGAGILVFALVRWIVIPLVRMPGRDAFVALVERRYPGEKNLIVNAYQLGDPARESQASGAPDLVESVVRTASRRIEKLDLRRWRDPAPDRPFLWAGGSALAAVGILALASPPSLLGALEQIVDPSRARPPEVTLRVSPGDLEVDRGADVAIEVAVTGTGSAPELHYRERNGAWRTRAFALPPGGEADAGGGSWETLLPGVDRFLEYKVTAPRAESGIYAIQVREIPRLAGFRAHLTYPAYTGLPTETLSSGTGDLAALKGTEVDLRILANRPMAGAYLDWRPDSGEEEQRIELEPVDETTWKAAIRLMEPASYAVVLTDENGDDRLRSPRYRVDPAPDRVPHLTLHFPQEDHDLAEDMMERVVADAADDYGFSSLRIRYRIDDGEEASVPYTPFTGNQTEFRLDTLWDLSGIDLLPGMVVSYYLEVRDNDTVTGPKAVRSPVRRIRFPEVSELYEEVVEDHSREIENLTGVQEAQEDLRERLEKLNTDLKRGREMNWELRQDVEQTLEKQQELERQVSDVVERLQETMSKASNRARMSQDLVQKMSEINELLDNLSNDELKRSFRELSRALERMDRNAIRRALENFNLSQEQMLRGMDRTIELLKQIRREEQMEDVAQRTEEIARLQEQIAEELEKLGLRPEDLQDGQPPRDPADADRPGDPADSRDRADRDGAQAGEEPPGAGETPEGDAADAESAPAQGSEASGGESTEGEPADASEGEDAEAAEPRGTSDSPEPEAAGEDPAETREGGSESSSDSESTPSGKGKQDSESSREGSQGSQSKSKSNTQEPQDARGSKASMQQLAQQQAEAEAKLEELKRLLRQLRRLNEDQADMARSLEELEQSQTTRSLQQNMQSAQANMSGGKPQEAAPYAFRAREEANRLAGMARSMQMQMQSDQEDASIAMVERIIAGLIDVSRVQEEIAREPGDTRELAQRQLNLTETTEAIAESLAAVMKQSFSMSSRQQNSLDAAISRMSSATDLFEQGNQRKAEHQARESASDVNETIVQLMRSHQQMCGGQAGGNASQQMQGLSQGQQQLNRSTRELLERLASKERLSMTDEQRMAQLAAQQEMIRRGLEELKENVEESDRLLGDLDQLSEDMKEVEGDLRNREVDPRIKDRQERILSRLLDAQRSIRQQEMSPQRQSRTGTLAARESPPPIPQDLLSRERTLEEDVLRGANDRYPTQYRRLVEEYFRALSRESRTP